MGLYAFTRLSETDQWNELWGNGKHIANRKYVEVKYSLYAIHKFFVEVELSNSDKIVGMKPFKTGAIMDKYVGNIDF